MEGPLDPRPVVVAEAADVLDDMGDVRLVDLAIEEHDLGIREAGLGPATQVQDDLDQRLLLGERVDGVDDLGRQRGQERVEVVDRFASPVSGQPGLLRGQRTPAGTSAGSATRTSVSFIKQGHGRDRTEARVLEPPVDRRLVGPDRRDHAVLAAGPPSRSGPG